MKRTKSRGDAEETERITAREFVRIWQSSNTLTEVSKKTRSKKNAVRVRAFRYRQMGVPLKQFPAVEIEPIDWDELAEFAESVEAGQVEQLATAEVAAA